MAAVEAPKKGVYERLLVAGEAVTEVVKDEWRWLLVDDHTVEWILDFNEPLDLQPEFWDPANNQIKKKHKGNWLISNRFQTELKSLKKYIKIKTLFLNIFK